MPTTETLGPDSLDSSVNRFAIPLIIVTPSATTYTIPNLLFDFTIDGIDFKTSTGTLNLEVLINSDEVVWTDASGETLGVDNAADDDTAASANVFSSGDNLGFEISSLMSSPTKLEVVLHCTRT